VILSVKERIRTVPLFYGPIARLEEGEPRTRHLVRQGDDLVIDGFPRSANTYAYHAFCLAQKRHFRVGNHTHAAAQFHLARRYNVPAMLAIREPVGAVVSLTTYLKLESPRLPLERYIVFHRSVLRASDSFVVADFQDITTRFSHCVSRINQRFATRFRPGDDNCNDIAASIRGHERILSNHDGRPPGTRTTLPSSQKEVFHAKVRQALQSGRYAKLLASAHDLYQQLSEQSHLVRGP
jgi:hypothetical protein